MQLCRIEVISTRTSRVKELTLTQVDTEYTPRRNSIYVGTCMGLLGRNSFGFDVCLLEEIDKQHEIGRDNANSNER